MRAWPCRSTEWFRVVTPRATGIRARLAILRKAWSRAPASQAGQGPKQESVEESEGSDLASGKSLPAADWEMVGHGRAGKGGPGSGNRKCENPEVGISWGRLHVQNGKPECLAL